MHIALLKLGQFVMPVTCENWPSLVNNHVWYACQSREICQVLPYSVDFKAHGEFWNPLSIPTYFDNLLDIMSVWYFHDMFSSNNIPRKLKVETRSISTPFIKSIGIKPVESFWHGYKQTDKSEYQPLIILWYYAYNERYLVMQRWTLKALCILSVSYLLIRQRRHSYLMHS